MKRDLGRQHGKAALELIEEAVHLLRSASSSQLAIYYAGTLPFVLAVLYFWGDMSRSPFAGQHLVEAASVLALLFVWMKTCQAVFSLHMRCLISGASPRLSPACWWRMAVTQGAFQPTGLFILPLALIPVAPFPWAFAFYQNLTSLADGQTTHVRALVNKAGRQAWLWPRQNHLVLLIMAGFAGFVCLNLISACFVLPGLIKMLFGIETVFTRSGFSLLNTTFFAATFGLAYLCLDPIVKTIYTLRCFYGESQKSGEDLKAELRRAIAAPLGQLTLAVVLLTFGLAPATLVAAEANVEAPAGPPASAILPADLDRAIQEVVQQPKFAWRQPRKKILDPEDSKPGFFRRLFDRIAPTLKSSFKTIGRWLEALFRRLFFRQRNASFGDAASRWAMFLHLLVYTLIAVTAAGLIWLFYRMWKNRGLQSPAILSQPLEPVPDLTDENLGADQLPEDSWMTLARKLLASGELRLALRAFYLATLAQLAAKNLIHLARFKSNRDYERELQRRAHSFPELLLAFGDNLSVFERIWYGMHEINNDLVNHFAENVERMRAAGSTPGPA